MTHALIDRTNNPVLATIEAPMAPEAPEAPEGNIDIEQDVAEEAPGITSFNSALESVEAGIAQSNKLLAKQKEITTEVLSIQEANTQALEHRADSQEVIDRQRSIAALQTQNDSRRIFKARGGVDRLVKLAGKARAAQDHAIQQVQDVTDLTNIDIVDDGFFTWLGAQVMMESEKEEADAAIASMNTIDNVVSKVTASTSATRAALNTIAETKTTATIAASSDVAAQQAIIDAGAARLQSELTKADQITRAMAANRDEVTLALRGYQLGRERDTAEALEVERAFRKIQIGKREEVDKAMVDGVNRGRIILGLDLQSRGEVLAGFSVKGESQRRLTSLFNLGTGNATPSNTLTAFTLNNANALIDGSNHALTALRASASSVATVVKNVALDEIQLRSAIDKKVRADFKAADANVDLNIGTAMNPNKAEPLSVLVQGTLVSGNAFIQGVVVPLKVEDMTPTQLLKLGATSIGTKDSTTGKKISLEDVVIGLTDLYATAVHFNNQKQDRERLELPFQTAYNAPVDIPGLATAATVPHPFKGVVSAGNVLFGGSILGGDFVNTSTIINFLDPVQVKSVLVRFINAKKAGSSVFDSL